jgi:hypothetical protein
MRDRTISIIVPVGAIKVTSDVVPTVCQKDARDCGGGEQDTQAGTLTDTEVSEYSRLGELLNPTHSQEQVVLAPCDAGGDHIWIELILTDAKTDVQTELTVVHIVPAAHIKEVGVSAVAVPLVEIKRYLWRNSTLLLICGGLYRAMEVWGLAFPLRDLVCGDDIEHMLHV